MHTYILEINIDTAAKLEMNKELINTRLLAKAKIVLFNSILFFSFQAILEKNRCINIKNLKNKDLFVPCPLQYRENSKNLAKTLLNHNNCKNLAKSSRITALAKILQKALYPPFPPVFMEILKMSENTVYVVTFLSSSPIPNFKIYAKTFNSY